MKTAETAFIALGSNVGDRVGHLQRAVEKIVELPGVRLTGLSHLYETSPVDVGGGPFVNAVARIKTTLDPWQLMEGLHDIESRMGRPRARKGPEPRTMDIDLLLYGGRVLDGERLQLPHPRMLSRRFVLEPLADLEPDMSIPGQGMSVRQAALILRAEHPEQKVARMAEGLRTSIQGV
ncbi:MAG: 2-amino-4-hydroxy-6-hydroxymethyldihydropteridine diphosphokinase [bacterium]|nr:MAG: 2-amino-4-hydroxy-6-hydroxymethyldihydropteridine diphosphokinase [bacterium]